MSRELGQLVVVGGEQRLGAVVLVQVLDDRPGQRQAVEGGGAAADLVEDHQALGLVAWCRMLAVSIISTMKVDSPRARSSLAPTRVKTRSTIRSRPRGPARSSRPGPSGRSARDLAQVGRLAAHVGAGEQHDLRALAVELDVVGHERGALACASTTGWRPSRITIARGLPHAGARSVARRHLGEGGQHVERGERRGEPRRRTPRGRSPGGCAGSAPARGRSWRSSAPRIFSSSSLISG
jgi:hypothetical protein